jgi:hypothetical protein
MLAATQEAQFPPAVVTQPDLFLPPPNAQPSNPQAWSSILQPGMRLVWFGMSASIPGERSQIVPDPDGTWINRRTGQKYRQFDTPSASGAGYLVADVLDASGNGVLSWNTSLLIHTDQNNVCTFIDANGGLSQRQDIGEFWVPPAQLAGYTDRNDAGLRVFHMPYSLGGRTYRSLRVQLQSGDGWSQNTYDLDTGLLLIGSSTTPGSPTVVIGPGNQINPGAGSTMMTYTQIAASRRTNLPGPGLVYPTQIRQLRALTYSGTRGVAMPGTGVQVPPTPLQVRYDIFRQRRPPSDCAHERLGDAGSWRHAGPALPRRHDRLAMDEPRGVGSLQPEPGDRSRLRHRRPGGFARPAGQRRLRCAADAAREAVLRL